ncbi:MAG: aspartate/glutamate racemase family protein [Rubrivivax sp.]|nr:aspartate/glutamate racemase family protein [Rubrivivax sp.]
MADAAPQPVPPAADGSFLGVLMLQTRFPRLPGDVGHPATFTMPVRRRIVAGATPQRVVREADPALLAPFVAAARELVAEGAAAITTSCGFLARWQHELQAVLAVPVWTSSLLALPALPRPGVITVDAAALDAAVLRGAGADPSTPVQGLDPASALVRTLLEDRDELDAAAAEATVLDAAAALLARAPDLQSLVLECTNLPPYAAALRRATGLPVHHLPSLVEARWSALGLRR